MKKYISVLLLILVASSPLVGAELQTTKKKRHLLITGCGRSGTAFTTNFLRKSGMRVGHETMGLDGSVSWLTAATINHAPWGPLFKNYQFKHILHQVRNPVKVIQSMYNHPPRTTWEWVAKSIPELNLKEDSELTTCTKYWIYWNKMAEKKAELTYRIEDIDKIRSSLSKLIHFPLPESALNAVSKKTNTRKIVKRKITWKTLQDELPVDVYQKLVETAQEYGYEVDLL